VSSLIEMLLPCISEALALTTHDIVGGSVTLRKATTKGKSATRTLPLNPMLAKYLKAYNPDVGFLGSSVVNMLNE